ncbi:unnamed protein product [Closterium sp. NIES-64]|nr:unnamed protein product [Closterium sp. NIES-64]
MLAEYYQPLPASFTQLSSLTSLDLDDCGEDQLPEALGALSNLRELKIQGNSIRTLPMSLLQLTALQTLEIVSCDFLSEVPLRLDMLVGLKKLVVIGCARLSRPPASLPTSLQTLHLSGHGEGCSSHVVDISGLLQLRELGLHRFKVRCGPVESGRLPCLQQLEKLAMAITPEGWDLPIAQTVLPRLRDLSVTCVDDGSSLPENMAATFPQLRELDLYCYSEELPGSVVEISSLTSLTLHAPRLTALPEGMTSLVQLRKLELIRCTALQHIPEFLTQLQQLILRVTSITVPANLLQLIEERSWVSPRWELLRVGEEWVRVAGGWLGEGDGQARCVEKEVAAKGLFSRRKLQGPNCHHIFR